MMHKKSHQVHLHDSWLCWCAGVSATVQWPTILHDSGTQGGVILSVYPELFELRVAAEYSKRCISNNREQGMMSTMLAWESITSTFWCKHMRSPTLIVYCCFWLLWLHFCEVFIEHGDALIHALLWCCLLRGHLISIKTKIWRSDLPVFVIPLAKMLQLMGETEAQDIFS